MLCIVFFPDLFEQVKPTVHRVQVLRWATCSKHMSIPAFLARHVDGVKLLFNAAAVDKIIAAKENWIATCADQVLLLQPSGSLGDSLFSAKLKDLVDASLCTQIKEKFDELTAQAVIDNTLCNAKLLAEWREIIHTSVEANVQSLDILKSKREVSIPFRDGTIPAVQVGCLTDQIDLVIVSSWKGAAVARGDLCALAAEEMLGFVSLPEEKNLNVDPAFVEQAFFSKHILSAFLYLLTSCFFCFQI